MEKKRVFLIVLDSYGIGEMTDAGAERVTNYCSDHTRTVPVGGKFEGRQTSYVS